MHKKLFLVFALLPLWASAQDTLNLESVIRIALEKNYAIKIAQRNKQIAANEVTLGNAGFLPLVTAQLNRQNNYFPRFRQTRQTIIPGDTAAGIPARTEDVTQDFSNRTNKLFNYGATVNWTIFDGMGMFIAMDRLEELQAAGNEQAQATIEITVADVSNAYYNIIQLQQRVGAFRNALDISAQRLDLAKAQYEVGSGSKLNFLAAQVDFNTDKSALIGQQQLLSNAKTTLNQLLGRTPSADFAVNDSIIVNDRLDLETLRAQALSQNPDLLVAQRNKSISALDRRLIQSQRLPQVNLFTGYSHNNQQNRAGLFPNTNLSDVVNYGVSATLTIFDGNNLNRRIQNQRITEDIRNLQLEDLRIRVEADVQRTFTDYRNALNLLQLEQENLKIAQQNVEIALERYRLGVATPLELREVQRNAVATASRLIDASYNAKLAETELQRLSSSIIQ
jgi:outer membrane protein TolC